MPTTELNRSAVAGGGGYLCVAGVVKGSQGQVDRRPYPSQWSLEPLLANAPALTERERAWLRGLQDKLDARVVDHDGAAASPLPDEDVRDLIRFFFPPFLREFRLGALVRPQGPNELLATPELYDVLTSGTITMNQSLADHTATVRAGMFILNQHYGQDIRDASSVIVDYRDAETGLVSNLRVIPGFDYVEVELLGKKPKLSNRDIRELLSNADDPELWERKLPADVFRFRGIEVNHVLDSTSEHSRSRLQHLLLKREAVLSEKRVDQIEEVLRNYVQVPDLAFGIQALDYPVEQSVPHKYLIRQDLLAGQVESTLAPAYGKSIYREACAHGSVRIYDDLRDCRSTNGELEERLMRLGYRSVVLVPLFGRGDHIIGMLELASKRPSAFNSLVLYQLEAIAPLFRQAVRRTRGDVEARIQAVMRERFTALDKSVEWRFVEAAADIIEAEQNEEAAKAIAPIRFEDVWALYAQADIVSSSATRNQSIREDMLVELAAARTLLRDPAVDHRFPLAGKLLFDIDQLTRELRDGLNPSEEQQVQEFLSYSFGPTLEQLRLTPDMQPRIEAYEAAIAEARPDGQTRRDAYEDSVRLISQVIAKVVEADQVDAQRIVPHFFSKYRTDGVEFNIYAGQSLLQTGTFTEVHLQNLRLWQLETMINVTKATAGIRGKLPIPLDTAQLIFTFGNTITIQFRMDEKRFDVEGAYNVRYEIIKKRIDKALIRGTEERLTIADHIAIVYAHHRDRTVYLDLLKYLHDSGKVVGEPEEFELEPMQGVDGLQALRVRVV